jgi:hypothetical protein
VFSGRAETWVDGEYLAIGAPARANMGNKLFERIIPDLFGNDAPGG